MSASTQNQALAALLFLYRELLERDLNLEGVVRARQRAVLERMDGVEALVSEAWHRGPIRKIHYFSPHRLPALL